MLTFKHFGYTDDELNLLQDLLDLIIPHFDNMNQDRYRHVLTDLVNLREFVASLKREPIKRGGIK